MILTGYMSQEKEERELASFEDCVDATIKRLEDDRKKSKERLITANQKQYRQHNDQHNNNLKREMGRITTA